MINELKIKLDHLCMQHNFDVGWSFVNLQKNESADNNGNMVFPSASTRKISILLCILAAVKAGKMDLKQPFITEEKNQDNDSGIFQHFYPGTIMTLHDALIGMISVSDNTCTGGIVELLGLDALNKYCQKIGMKGTAHRFGLPPHHDSTSPAPALDRTNTTTPNDVCNLLRNLHEGTFDDNKAAFLSLDKELCQLGIDILFMQELNARLPLMLPYEARIAHKTGTVSFRGIFNDAGIVYKENKPLCAVAVYTNNVPHMIGEFSGKYIASKLIAEIGRACYDFCLEQ